MAPTSAFIQAPGTSGQKPVKQTPSPTTGSFSVSGLASGTQKGLLTKNSLAPTPVSPQGTPSAAQVKTGFWNTPLNSSTATQPVTTVKPTNPLTNIKAPVTTLPQGFQQKSPAIQTSSPNGGQSSTQNGTNSSQMSSTGPQEGGGFYNPGGNYKSDVSSPVNGLKTDTQYAAPNYGGLYGQLISQLQQKSQGPSADYVAQQSEANKYNEALKQSRINQAKGLADNASNPIPLEFQQGRAQVLQNQYTQEQAALGSAFQGASSLLGSANTQQSTQQSGLSSAAGLAQPVGQFGLLTNPITGQPLNTGVFQNAVQQAAQLVQNGADPQGQAVQSLLSQFGFIGQSAFTQAMQTLNGGGYNPTAQSAAVNQNVSQGVQTQGQAYNLNLGLQQLKTIQPIITNFLATSGINPTDSGVYNAPINDYIAKLGNPAATAQYATMLNDVQKFASQMLAAGSGGTPTGVQAATALMDPSKLSMNQIQYYLNTLDTLGTNQIAVLQSQAQSSFGGQPSAYAGNPATISNSTPVAPQSTAPGGGLTTPAAQGAAGVGLGVGSWALSQAKNLGSELVGFIGGLLAK